MVRIGWRIVVFSLAALLAAASHANPVVSFGVQGGQPSEETLDGTTVRLADAVDVDTAVILFGLLPDLEDLDAFHVRDNGDVLFSTTTAVNLGGTNYQGGDVVRYDGVGFSLALSGGLFQTTENVDAVSELPNGNLLISTATPAEIFGFAFADGDVVEVDVIGGTAGLYMGLNELALFTGANQNVDALHHDRFTGSVFLSVLSDGPGTVAGYLVTSTGASADLIEVAMPAVSGSLYLDGAGLYDGKTRQLDAAFLIRECDDGLDNDGDGLADHSDDPGCDHADDVSERSLALVCDDGHDNDGDLASDFPGDPGCFGPISTTEDPACSDGINNDPGQDALIDFDGGLWALGYVATAPDPQCNGLAWQNKERKSQRCGLGWEVTPILVGLGWVARRRGRRRQT